MDIEKIIEVAKTKELWSASGNYNYGPMEYFKKEVLNGNVLDENGKISWKKHESLFDLYEKNVHRVTDWKTFLTREYGNFDVYVDVTELICTMNRTFPETSQRSILLHIGKLLVEDECKTPSLDHRVLKDCIREMGMTTYELLGITLT